MTHATQNTCCFSLLSEALCLSSDFAGFDVHVCFRAVFSQHMKFNSCGSSAEQKW